MEQQRNGFSTAARLGAALSIVGVALAVVLGNVSTAVEIAVVLTTILVAFASSLVATQPQPTNQPRYHRVTRVSHQVQQAA